MSATEACVDGASSLDEVARGDPAAGAVAEHDRLLGVVDGVEVARAGPGVSRGLMG